MDGKGLPPCYSRLLPITPPPELETNLTNNLLTGIVVLNANYFPSSPTSAPKVGATAFAMSAVQVLQKIQAFSGMLLYKRDEELSYPSIIMELRNTIVCATVSFNFGMKSHLLKNAISAAAQLLAADSARTPMLYYQTDTLLQYHPTDLPLCVTHHGPFYDDFASHFSDELAGVAFGSQAKARHLKIQQNSGLHYLKTLEHAYVFQHSDVQGNHLLKSGIDPAKIFPLCPPIHSMRVQTHHYTTTHSPIHNTVSQDQIFLFTAVARLDYFKNIDLLVDAAIELITRNHGVTVLIAGDDENDHIRRTNLRARIPERYLEHFEIIPKLQKNTLYALFEHAKHYGIFVCPSRYETLGITPLEAGLNGVATLIPQSTKVEASRYFPQKYRFNPTALELADTVETLHKSRVSECGKELRKHLETRISDDNFRLDFLQAWMECSHKVQRSRQRMVDLFAKSSAFESCGRQQQNENATLRHMGLSMEMA